MLYIKCSDYEISVLLIIKNDATDVARGSPHFKLFSQKEESAPLVSPLREPWFGDWINRSLDSLGDLLSTLDSKMLLDFSWFGTHIGNVFSPCPLHTAACILVTGCQENSLGKMVDITDQWLEWVGSAFQCSIELNHFYSIGISGCEWGNNTYIY